jgi:plasmid stabilization system protein ParE
MTFQVRFTEEAAGDLERLYDFLLQGADGDWTLAERALAAIRGGLSLLETSPFAGRKLHGAPTFLRELVIGFGRAGYVALFEVEDDHTVTILAVRHQREDDFS